MTANGSNRNCSGNLLRVCLLAIAIANLYNLFLFNVCLGKIANCNGSNGQNRCLLGARRNGLDGLYGASERGDLIEMTLGNAARLIFQLSASRTAIRISFGICVIVL